MRIDQQHDIPFIEEVSIAYLIVAISYGSLEISLMINAYLIKQDQSTPNAISRTLRLSCNVANMPSSIELLA